MTSSMIFGTAIDARPRRKPGRPRSSAIQKQRAKHIACAEMRFLRGWKVTTVAKQLRASVRSVIAWTNLALTYPECDHLVHFARPHRRPAA